MSNYNNFSKMFKARCKIPNIVRKIFFRYNLLLIPITIENKMFSINLRSLFDSRSIPFGELCQPSRSANHSGSNRGLTRRDNNYSVIVSWAKIGFYFLFILVFWRLFRNNFPRYTVRYVFQRKINILMKFPSGFIVFRNVATRKFFANSWYYEPAK